MTVGHCEPLVEAVADRLDRAWDCPDCGSDLQILRRGGLLPGAQSGRRDARNS